VADGVAGSFLAGYWVQIIARGDTSWKHLRTNTEQSYFEEIVRKERTQRRMEDDDMTMLVIPIV